MSKFLRIFGVIAVVVLIFGAIIASTTAKPNNAEKVWDTAMTTGVLDGGNYFIVYSDLVCPYCVAFENAIIEHEDEFQQYLKDNDVLFEVRVSDFLYEYGEHRSPSSRYSAVAAYCARDEGKFWDYYNLAVPTVWNDYFKDSGKSGLDGIDKLDKKYWIKIGEKVGLGDSFKACVEEEKPLDEIKANAKKTAGLVSGLPSFKLNSYSPPGFAMDGTWEDVLTFFDAGLGK